MHSRLQKGSLVNRVTIELPRVLHIKQFSEIERNKTSYRHIKFLPLHVADETLGRCIFVTLLQSRCDVSRQKGGLEGEETVELGLFPVSSWNRAFGDDLVDLKEKGVCVAVFADDAHRPHRRGRQHDILDGIDDVNALAVDTNADVLPLVLGVLDVAATLRALAVFFFCLFVFCAVI